MSREGGKETERKEARPSRKKSEKGMWKKRKKVRRLVKKEKKN